MKILLYHSAYIYVAEMNVHTLKAIDFSKQCGIWEDCKVRKTKIRIW